MHEWTSNFATLLHPASVLVKPSKCAQPQARISLSPFSPGPLLSFTAFTAKLDGPWQ